VHNSSASDFLSLCYFILSREGSLLSIVFVLGTEMKHLNKKNNSYIMAATTITTLFTLAIMAASSMAAPAEATTTTATTPTTS
jgi:hypothetical protein